MTHSMVSERNSEFSSEYLGLRRAFRSRQAAHWASGGQVFPGVGFVDGQIEQPHIADVPRLEDLGSWFCGPIHLMEDGDIYQPNIKVHRYFICVQGWSHFCRIHMLEPNRSVFCCCADCVSPFILQFRHAQVAVSMTCLATTGGPLPPGCVVRLAKVSTNVFVRDLDIKIFNTIDSRRLEVVQMSCLFLWRSTGSTPRWCQFCVGVGVRGVTRHPETELFCC